MSILDALNPITGLFKGASDIIDQFVKTPEDKLKAQRLLQDQQTKALTQHVKAEAERAKTVRAEITGHSWLQRNWRPIGALVFIFIIFNNYVLVPYAKAFGAPIPQLPIPGGMWALLTTMIGGYTVGRTYEKTLANKAKDSTDTVVQKVLNAIGDATS